MRDEDFRWLEINILKNHWKNIRGFEMKIANMNTLNKKQIQQAAQGYRQFTPLMK
jgi:hypothetical protein